MKINAALLGLLFLAACSSLGFPQGPGFPPKWLVSPQAVSWTPSDSAECAGPCWRGLVIGKSTEADVMAALQKLTFIDHQTVSRVDAWVPGLDGAFTSGTRISVRCLWQTQTYQGCVEARLVTDVLTWIDILPNAAFTLDQAMSVLGHPDYVGASWQGAETVICDISLVWQDRQLFVTNTFYSTPSDFWGPCKTFDEDEQFKVTLPVNSVSYTSRASLDAELVRQGYAEYLPFADSMLLP